jgi:hypothetical protein
MGSLIAYSGDWDHGCDIVQRAMQLNPNPGWYWAPQFLMHIEKVITVPRGA